MEIKGIWQDKDTVYISAHLDDQPPTMTVIEVVSSQYVALKVNKENMTQFGEITFILLDDEGKERARAVYDISQ
jgi:hypothetical protein